MLKTAYSYGVQTALVTTGLLKLAGTDDPGIHDTQASNPAEMLANLFQQAEQGVGKQTPDNKTRDATDSDSPVHWGNHVPGHGGDRLQRMVPGMVMPEISAV